MAVPTKEQIEARRKELIRTIALANDELSRLDNWIHTGESLFDLKSSQDTVARPRYREARRLSRLAQYAEAVLKRSGPLHVNELVERMRREGWVSTGDSRKDGKNVHSSLTPNRRFKNLGRNVWAFAANTEERTVVRS
jgi:hypothetical protein